MSKLNSNYILLFFIFVIILVVIFTSLNKAKQSENYYDDELEKSIEASESWKLPSKDSCGWNNFERKANNESIDIPGLAAIYIGNSGYNRLRPTSQSLCFSLSSFCRHWRL